MTKTLSWPAAGFARPFSATLLYFVADTLSAASERLARLAGRVATVEEVPAQPVETVEFHALHREAGAPEGALYVNGRLVAVIPGVTRL